MKFQIELLSKIIDDFESFNSPKGLHGGRADHTPIKILTVGDLCKKYHMIPRGVVLGFLKSFNENHHINEYSDSVGIEFIKNAESSQGMIKIYKNKIEIFLHWLKIDK